MSTTPMTSDQWVKQLHKFGVKVNEQPGFRDPHSGRDDETGLKFGPVYGCVIHHTGDDAPDSLDRKVIANGRSDLPGPLAHSGMNDDGSVDMFTAGRANHAGGGDPVVLAAVKDESYGSYPPHTNKHQGSSGAADGNDCFYGLESYYYKNLTKVQYGSMVAWAAAICDFHGWSSKSVIGHKEWSDYKIDPAGFDMAKFRKDVDTLIKAVNGGPTPSAPAHKPTTPNITAAIKAGIDYEKALEAIRLKGALPSTDEAVKQVQQQRRSLRQHERNQK